MPVSTTSTWTLPALAVARTVTVRVPGVTAIAVEGHTPGHSAFEIVDGDARLLYIGDAAHHFAVSVQRPQWTIAFDGDAPVAEASREALLARIADSGDEAVGDEAPAASENG